MGFFKELIQACKEGLKEGVEEAREELAAEKAAEQAAQTDFLNRISYEEQFGVALGAPFRTNAFNDWFFIFKDGDDTDDEFPRHLYAASEPGLVEKSDLKDLRELMERDFGVTDERSALWMAGQLFTAAAVPSQTEFPVIEKEEEDTWADWAQVIYNTRRIDDECRKNVLTLVAGMAAHGIAASADIGCLKTETALSLLADLRVFVKSLYGEGGTWGEYGMRFLAGNDTIELNDEKGMKFLRGHVQHLLEKPGSPWVNVPFYVEGEEIIPFAELVTLPEIFELYEEDEIEAVDAHIETYFGKSDRVFHEIVSPDIHLDVVIIEPNEERSRIILVTQGAGAHIMDVPEELHDNNLYRMELVMVLPADWNIDGKEDADYWPIGTLKAVGRYALEQETWLGWGHSVQFGAKEEYPETDFAGYMLVFPLIGGEEARVCELPDGTDVNFYQLIPLYEEEMAFKIEHGSDALLEKLFAAFGEEYDGVIDPKRRSVL
ncbi:MAG: suppressor of fused domain protein [Deltaproteobacteria bacterium]|nr:suppressor of fused domain protein [Deltaproteobacteria bacterium]